MRRTHIPAAAFFASLAITAGANDGSDLRTKALASAATAATAAATIREISATPAQAVDAGMPILPVMGETDTFKLRNECAGRDICYDASAGHVVVRPAREFMPHINGLTPENLSVRHNRVLFTYSFK